MEVVRLVLLFASPALIVVVSMWLGAMNNRIPAVATIAFASLAPGVIIFVGTREADAITNAAAYAVAPAFCLYGLFVALVTEAVILAAKK